MQLVEARELSLLVPSAPTIEGAGVHLRRSLGSRALPQLDPFLLLDDIHSDRASDYESGFPRHPHRGFETVTYVISGVIEHQDSMGNRGRLTDGSAQWMTAGHGIVHSEMPKQESGVLWGLQLWVNLPKASKLVKPRYQDIAPGRIPEISATGSKVRLVAGALQNETGPVTGIVQDPTMLDVTLEAGRVFEHGLAPSHTAFIYVLDGAIELGTERTIVPAKTLAVLGPGALFRARGSSSGGRLLLLAAAPIGEPVARRGPFVMNTEDELDQAVSDYQTGRLTEI